MVNRRIFKGILLFTYQIYFAVEENINSQHSHLQDKTNF